MGSLERVSESSTKLVGSAQANMFIQIQRLSTSLELAKQLFEKHEDALQRAGWDLTAGALETTTNSRISIPE